MDKARENPNIKWLLNRKVVEIKGDGLVESIVVEDVRDGSREEIHASQEDGIMGIFAFIGLIILSTMRVKVSANYLAFFCERAMG